MSHTILVALLSLICMLVNAFQHWQIIKVQCAENDTEIALSEFSTITQDGSNIDVSIVLRNCATFVLFQSLHFSNIHYLHLKGENKTIVKCVGNKSSNVFITNVSNLTLESITVENCGSPLYRDHPAAVMIELCNSVTIKYMKIYNSNGTGMILNRTNGNVTIDYSDFKNCHWQPGSNFYQYNGGGLTILYHMQFVRINNSVFLNNSAYIGGGMSIIVKHLVNIDIKSTSFISNKAPKGGGVRITYHKALPATHITFDQCAFENNNAIEGGGTSVSYETYDQDLHLNFRCCRWNTNSFQAIYLENRQTKKSNFAPVFFNCSFTKNGHIYISNNESTNAAEGNAFVISDLSVKFQGVTVFKNNTGSAIKAISSNLKFDDNSINVFIGNRGITGGALQLLGTTVITLGRNQSFKFISNQAKDKGGVIYVDPYKYVSSVIEQTCFINLTYADMYLKDFDTNYIFEENCIEDRKQKNILHAISIKPCLKQDTIKQNLLKLKTKANLTRSSQFSTAAHAFIKNEESAHCPLVFNPMSNSVKLQILTEAVHVIPGKKQTLNLRLVDEFCNNSPFYVNIMFENTAIHLLNNGSEIHDNSITL